MIENQITYLRPILSPKGPPKRADRHSAQEKEQMHLGALHRDAEGMDQIEGVILPILAR